MITIEPGNAILGAKVTGVDLARSLADDDFALVLRALAHYGEVEKQVKQFKIKMF